MKEIGEIHKDIAGNKTFNYSLIPQCNNNCIMCVFEQPDKRVGPSLGEINESLSKIDDSEFSTVYLTGGEPTLLNELASIIESLRERFSGNIHLLTNGRRFSVNSYIGTFPKNLGSFVFCVPFHSHKEESFESITRVPGSFNQTCQGIKNLSSRYSVELRVVMHKMNYQDLPSISRYICSEFPSVDKVLFIAPDICGNAIKNKDKVGVKLEEVVPYLEEALFILEGKYQIRINQVPLCLLKKDNRCYAYNPTIEEGEHVKGPMCSECDLNNMCGGIWKNYADNYGFSELGPLKNIPEEVKIELTTECNLDCEFCFNDKTIKDDLEIEDVYKIIDESYENGVNAIRFTGGEPFLRSDLKKILKYAKSKRIYVILNTNGTLLKKNIKLIKYVDDILISVHNPDRFDEIIEIIESINKKNKEIVLRCCTIASKENIKNLDKFYEFFYRSVQVDDWFLLRPVPTDTYKEPLSFYDVKLLVDKISRLNEKYGESLRIANSLPFCSYVPEKISSVCIGGRNDSGHTRMVVDSRGDIKTDYFSSEIMGNIKAQGLIEIWKSKNMSDRRILQGVPTKCEGCRYLCRCKSGLSFALKDEDYLMDFSSFFLEDIKGIVFFRDDDVSELTPKLKRLIKIFVDAEVPVNLEVIPNKLSLECLEYLLSLKELHPELVDFHQHGFSHENHNPGKIGSEKEFGDVRSYKEQYEDLASGKKIMEDSFGDSFSPVFCPPYYGYNKDTLRSLVDLGFRGFSGYFFEGMNSIQEESLKDISANVEMLDQGNKGVFFREMEDVKKDILLKIVQSGFAGIVLHHELMEDKHFVFLRRLLDVFKSIDIDFKIFREMI